MTTTETQAPAKSDAEKELEQKLADALKELETLKKKIKDAKGSPIPKGKRRVFIVPAKINGDYSTRAVDGKPVQFVTLSTNGKKVEVLANKQVDVDEDVFTSHESFLSPFEVK
jgi:hypothetical protein